ncbi:MAG: peptidase S8 and S53 subtilisin kexin sedolisin, partial [Cellulosilyticum sp.]|nr:peptidase S8 and S53 subtilisin kexin sedolisin [Cellulosilyticum sp.]
MQNKTDASLQILSIVPDSEIQQSDEYLAVLGFDQPGNWEVLVKYNGDIERIAELEGGRAQIINDQFATLSIPRENIANLLNYTQVEY